MAIVTAVARLVTPALFQEISAAYGHAGNNSARYAVVARSLDASVTLG
jgi:hypothetical protein